MMEFFQNTWIIISTALIIGIIIGLLIIRPILKKIEEHFIQKNLYYWIHLIVYLRKMSLFFGVALLLNVLRYYPINITFQDTLTKTLKVFNSVIITYLIAEILIFIYEKYANFKADEKVSSLFHILIRILVYIVGAVVISDFLGYDIKAMLTALGVGGLAVALALQDTLGNLFAGMQILASKQLKPGDYIKLEENVEGYVLDINWRNTTIRTLLENIIIVPNSKISSSITTNYFTLQKNFYFKISVGVHYDSDLEFVEKITLEVAKEVLSKFPNVPQNFTPRVRFYEFADSSINFKVWLATDLYENQIIIQHQFIKDLQAKYNKEGIVIPFPIRTLYMEK